MSTSVRKRGTNITEGDISDSIKGADDAVKISDDKPDKVMWTLVLLVLILLLYNIAIPSSTKISHKKAIEQQLESIANKIEQQHKSLAMQYDSFSSQLSEKLKKVSKIQNQANIDQSETDDEGNSTSLQENLDDSESKVSKLRDEIAKLQEEMGKIHGEMEFDQSTFCEDCTGNFEGGKLHVKCSERRDWLMEKFQHSNEVATEAIEKIDPDNCKKHHQDPSDHAIFCEDCVGQFSGGLRIKCGKRRDYLMQNYGDSKEQATEAVMSMDPINCVKQN
mmetsp:Transcript_32259/g.47683  ORF Transcript_32259/g.47683 Transcript_32259/m.47683 type:complete len:277 (+) Transcript_32259:88-918(+)